MRTVTSYQIAKARLRSMRNSGHYTERDYLNGIKMVKEGIKQGDDKPSVRNGFSLGVASIFRPM